MEKPPRDYAEHAEAHVIMRGDTDDLQKVGGRGKPPVLSAEQHWKTTGDVQAFVILIVDVV